MTTETKLAQQYQRKTDRQHILDNPDTYIGSVENIDANIWIIDDDGKNIVEKEINYIPGLYKLFDEANEFVADELQEIFSVPIDV
jgi:DNA topoisomerase-2